MKKIIKEALPKGTLLKGKYTYYIEAPLGQGSFGITYRAKVILDGEYGSLETLGCVAIKEFFMKDLNGRKESTLSTGNDSALFNNYLEKFRKEVVNLSNLHHPGIVKVIEAFSANSTSYYVMEYISGETLDDKIIQQGKLDFESAYGLISDICVALKYMHENHMLHLDLKPGNIMLRENNLPVLIDFGLSKHYDELGEVETTTTIGLGTPGYAPIEQNGISNKDNLSASMDVYALGGILFKMLTGVTPPPAVEIINDRDKLTSHLVSANIHECVVNLILSAMHPLKRERIQNVNTFKCELEDCFQNIQEQKTESILQSGNEQLAESLQPETEPEDTIIANSSDIEDESVLKEENENNTVDIDTDKRKSKVWLIFKRTLCAFLFMFVYLLMMYGYLFIRYDNFYQYEFFYITVTDNQKKGLCNLLGFEIIDTEYDDVDYLGQGLCRVEQNNKYGIVNTHNEAVTGIIYDDMAYYITEKLIEVEMNGKSGFIDLDGKTVIPFIYTYINSFNEGLCGAVKDGKWGYINPSGDSVIPFIYDDAFPFCNGFANVKNNGKWGRIDINGNEVVKPTYDDIYLFSSKYIKVKRNGKYGFINDDWVEIVPTIYDEIGGVNNRYASVKRNAKWGRLDLSTGKETVAPIYEELGYYRTLENREVSLVKRDGKYGYIDRNWNEVLEPVYDRIITWNGNLQHVRRGDKHGLIDHNFKEVLPIVYDNIVRFFTGDKLIKIQQKSLYGLIDETGKIVIKPIYDDLVVNDNGTIKVKLGEKYGLLDHTGKIIVPFIYDAVMNFSEGTANVKKTNKWGVINTKGEIIMDVKNDTITPMRNGRAFIQRAGKWGGIDINGNEIISPSYDIIKINKDNIKIRQEGKWGCMDTNLNILVYPKYEELRDFNKTYLIAQSEGKWGIVDQKMKEHVPPIYDEINAFYLLDDGVARIRLDNKWGLINDSLVIVVEPEFETIIRNYKYYILRNPSYSYLYHLDRNEIIKKPDEIQEIMGIDKVQKNVNFEDFKKGIK